jgi:hypothetical protein
MVDVRANEGQVAARRSADFELATTTDAIVLRPKSSPEESI